MKKSELRQLIKEEVLKEAGAPGMIAKFRQEIDKNQDKADDLCGFILEDVDSLIRRKYKNLKPYQKKMEKAYADFFNALNEFNSKIDGF